MSLYDGLEVETAPIPEISPMEKDSPAAQESMNGGKCYTLTSLLCRQWWMVVNEFEADGNAAAT